MIHKTKYHTHLLNYLASTFSLKSYLEIGVQNRANNFNHVKCTTKFCVDPDAQAKADFVGTSDKYFESSVKKYDLVFIDGLHSAEQVKKDFDNSLRQLNKGGFIVLHDCNPAEERFSHFPRDCGGVWNGDVYKFICRLNEYDAINFYTIDEDHGCCVAWKDDSRKGFAVATEINWAYFSANKHLLRLVSDSEFKENCAPRKKLLTV